ncbi:hypothetical protein [Streptomyces shenzhenensis]|uniref:hypothetical protein n=1 Tax=Streptomyces shenzhenensis TaxID=943815 RepID=UPI001F474512|nr:hypothetical protein [Streptomyces shenzhenensis]
MAEALFTRDSRAAADALVDDGRRATTVSDVVEVLIRAVGALQQAPDHYRARVELQLEAARTPALLRHLHTSRTAFVEALAEALTSIDEPDAQHRAEILVTVVDGVPHRRLLLGRPSLAEDGLRALLHRRFA